MSIILDLPSPINEELTTEAQREGISERERAALLICVASAFRQDEPSTPFQMAIRNFLAQHSLDAEQVFSVFEELIRTCLDTHELGKYVSNLQDMFDPSIKRMDNEPLKQWRNSSVHQPVEASHDALLSDVPLVDTVTPFQDRVNREVVAEEAASDSNSRVQALLTQWQIQDRTPLRPAPASKADETPTQALFRKWAEEDSNMTEEEKEAEDRLWEDIEQGIKDNRLSLNTNPLAS